MAKTKSHDPPISVNWAFWGRGLVSLANFLKWPIVLIVVVLILDPAQWEKWPTVNTTLVLSYLDVLIWPFIVLLLIYVMRPHLPELVRNLRRLSSGKLSAEFGPSQESPGEGAIDLRKSSDSQEPALELTDQDELDPGVHEALTSDAAKLAFEQVYREIYGTQLTLLKRLANEIPNGLEPSQLRDIYDAHVESTENPYPTFISFVQYLLDNALVLLDSEDARYKITNAGVYFLRYLHEKGLYERFRAN
jgi:hypothetical protein